MNSIVIGSGFGGIAAALRLRAKGHKVTLIEKHPDLGGRARVFKRNGFIFDGGPTVITAPYLIQELFELFKKNPKDYIELSPLKIWYQFVFEDNSKFNYSGDEKEMKKQIKNSIFEKINLVWPPRPKPLVGNDRTSILILYSCGVHTKLAKTSGFAMLAASFQENHLFHFKPSETFFRY